MESKRRYQYKGQVTDIFGNVIDRSFTGRTIAGSEKKALNNLQFQWKMSHNYPRDSKIFLSGVLTPMGEIELKGAG